MHNDVRNVVILIVKETVIAFRACLCSMLTRVRNAQQERSSRNKRK